MSPFGLTINVVFMIHVKIVAKVSFMGLINLSYLTLSILSHFTYNLILTLFQSSHRETLHGEHNKEVLTRAKSGDRLEFPRGLYSHWGVYVDNDKVIHLDGGA
jgi:hypothetical protein